MKKRKKSKEQILLEKIKKIYERYPEREIEIKNWNNGGFYKDDKYKQPIKHRLYK